MVIILMMRITASYDLKYGYCCSAKVILLVSFNGNYKEMSLSYESRKLGPQKQRDEVSVSHSGNLPFS